MKPKLSKDAEARITRIMEQYEFLKKRDPAKARQLEDAVDAIYEREVIMRGARIAKKPKPS